MPNQRVSLEEVRAKRLAKEAKKAEDGKVTEKQELMPIPPDESRPEPTAPLEAQQSRPHADAQPTAEAAPETVPAAAPSPVASPLNLEEFLAAATPEQLQRIRVLAASNGLAVPSA